MGSSSQPTLQSLDKALLLLVRVAEDENTASLSTLAQELNLPASSVHRLLSGLERAGFIVPIRRGHYVRGPTLRRLTRVDDDANRVLKQISAPILAALSRRTGKICHLGVLEDNMMTYLVKEGDVDERAISRCGTQLEAYCTGIGKALLAHLPHEDKEAYLASGPFVTLTRNTLVSSQALTEEFDGIAARGYAIDNQEMIPGLICIAAPIRNRDRVIAAISLVVTQTGDHRRPTAYLGRLLSAAHKIENQLSKFDDLFIRLK